MAQFQGAGHGLDTYLWITPEGLKPTYLESIGNLPEVPPTRLDGEMRGTFVVGEGAYDVEALVMDDSRRACHAETLFLLWIGGRILAWQLITMRSAPSAFLHCSTLRYSPSCRRGSAVGSEQHCRARPSCQLSSRMPSRAPF